MGILNVLYSPLATYVHLPSTATCLRFDRAYLVLVLIYIYNATSSLLVDFDRIWNTDAIAPVATLLTLAPVNILTTVDQ